MQVLLPNDKSIVSFPITGYGSFPLLRIVAESFVSPTAIYEFDLTTMAGALRSMAPLAATGYDHTQYSSERVYVTSSVDGLPIPLSIMYK